jgi:hypothetical protein
MSMRFNGLPFQPRRKKRRDALALEVSLFARDGAMLVRAMLKEFLKGDSSRTQRSEVKRFNHLSFGNLIGTGEQVEAVMSLERRFEMAKQRVAEKAVAKKTVIKKGRKPNSRNQRTKDIERYYTASRADGLSDVAAKEQTVDDIAEAFGLNVDSPRGKTNVRRKVDRVVKDMMRKKIPV